MKAVFSTAAYAGLLVETQEKIRTETGGVFLGCFREGVWYIIETIDPGPKSVFRIDYFEYDQPYIAHLINKRARLYKENLTLVGLWHRHPGSFDVFSTTDDGTNAQYAALSDQGALSMLVNIDPVFRLSVFHVGKKAGGRPSYSLIPYEVGDDKIPPALMEKKSIPDLQNGIDRSGIRAMGLREYIKNVARNLKKVPDDGEISPEENVVCLHEHMEEQDIQMLRDRLIDLVLEQIAYLSDTIRFPISASWADDAMEISETANSGKRPVFRFKYLIRYDCAAMEYDGQLYFCREDMFHPDRISISPAGTLRGAGWQNRGAASAPARAEGETEPDLEQAYTQIRNSIYRFFQRLMDGNDQKG